MREVLLAVRDAERRVLAQDVALIDRLELRERALAAKRIPDVPARRLVGDVLDRATEERPLELGLVARGVRAAEHREVVAQLDVAQRRLGEERPHVADEVRRVLAPRQEAEAARVHRVGVDDAGDLPRLQDAHELGADRIGRALRAAAHRLGSRAERGRRAAA